jgi:hypothetical protein
MPTLGDTGRKAVRLPILWLPKIEVAEAAEDARGPRRFLAPPRSLLIIDDVDVKRLHEFWATSKTLPDFVQRKSTLGCSACEVTTSAQLRQTAGSSSH